MVRVYLVLLVVDNYVFDECGCDECALYGAWFFVCLLCVFVAIIGVCLACVLASFIVGKVCAYLCGV